MAGAGGEQDRRRVGGEPEQPSKLTPLLKKIKPYTPKPDPRGLERPSRTAEEPHKGQPRLSGEPFIEHPLAVAQILADKENAADAIGGVMPDEVKDPVVNEILVDLKKRESLNSAQMLAKDILHDLSKVEPVKYKTAKRARFMVLTEPRMPSVLVELDFISNPRRERLLAQPGHRQQLAEALSRASLTFLQQEGRLDRAPRPVVASKRTYVVKPGDSLWDIARRYNVSEAGLRQMNHLRSTHLQVGQELTLPDSNS